MLGTFEYCERTIPELKLLLLQTLYERVASLGLFSLNSLVDLIDISDFLGSPLVHFLSTWAVL